MMVRQTPGVGYRGSPASGFCEAGSALASAS